MASAAPTATPTATWRSKKTTAARMSTPANRPFRPSILASSFGPIGCAFFVSRIRCLDFGAGLARGVDHALEAGGDAEEQEHQEQPGLGAQPAVEEVAGARADGDGHAHLQAERGETGGTEERPRGRALVFASLIQAGRVLAWGAWAVKGSGPGTGPCRAACR